MRKLIEKITALFRRKRAQHIGPKDFVRVSVKEPRVLTIRSVCVGYAGFEEAVKHKAAIDLAEIAMQSGMIRYEIEEDQEIPGWLTVRAYLKVVENT